MTQSEQPRCLVCNQTSDQIPLLMIEYQGHKYYICPSHFPILIHQPDKLIGKLPGAENLQAHKD
jgi:hypothetical protein